MSAAVDLDRKYHNTTRDARYSARSKTRPTVRAPKCIISTELKTADLDKIIRRESHTHAREVPARALSPVVRVVSQRTLPVPIRYSPSVEARRLEVKARLKWTDKMASTAMIGLSARLAPTVVAKVSRTRQSRAHRSYRVRAAAKEDKGEPEAGTPTIDSKSLWRLRLELFSGKDANASAPDRTVTVRARFVVDEGYEPPQGSIEIEDDEELAFVQAGFHRWTMAEVRRHTALKNCPTRISPKLTDSTSGTAQDPNERKAGLWIWGLFEEPLYPYMLLSFDCNRIEVAEGGYHIPKGKLFAEVKHARGSKSGHVLSDGKLSFKVTKTYKADLVGLSQATIGEPTICGRLQTDCIEVA